MNKTYHYVVLRLATDDLRGETINVGIVLFSPADAPQLVMMATLNKLRALDVTWDTPRLTSWSQNVRQLIDAEKSPQKIISTLAAFSFCDEHAIGMFMADTPAELERQLADVKCTYVANKASTEKVKREKRTRLQTALRDQFKKMHVLGHEVTDLANHLVVANVPVPSHSELKTDFVYKNGIYRITQTFDYQVAPDSLPNKLAEACVKSTAAELAMRTYGANTLRLAVMDIPEEFADATDAHVDLLLAQGFQVFKYGDQANMADYLKKAAPALAISGVST